MSGDTVKAAHLSGGSAEQRRLIAWLGRHRTAVQVGLDLLAWGLAFYAALWFRFEFDLDQWPNGDVLVAIGIAFALQLAAGFTFGLYQGRWRFGSFEEVAALAKSAALVGFGVFVASRLVFDPRLLPDSVIIGGALSALLLMGAVRYVWRLVIDRRRRPKADDATPVIVFGAGEAGTSLVTTMLRNPTSPLFPVAMLDDHPAKQKLKVLGVPVMGGREQLRDVAQTTGANQLVIAIPSGRSELFRELSALATDAGLAVSVLPAVEEMLNGSATVADVRPIDVRDLLGRHEIHTDIDQIAGYITGKRVLVTGAGGSIGSELCRQLHRFAPEQLVMLDRDESALHGVQLSIEGRALLDSRNIVVADIRDKERMIEVFEEHQPHVVFHAAALKHLPLLEMHPSEGVKTNIYGTQNLLEVSRDHHVERFVNVSTDKAADPISVLGYTKRIAERLTAAMAEEAEGTYLSVRFGNVLGSRGSVLKTFEEQIAAGGPVTVTHPDVTRYFMTVEEAVQLVIQAGAIGRSGEALILDMGQPVRITDVASQMIALSGRNVSIQYTRLRHGEKMHEQLISDGEVATSLYHPHIAHVSVPPLGYRPLDAARISAAALVGQLATVCAAFARTDQTISNFIGQPHHAATQPHPSST